MRRTTINQIAIDDLPGQRCADALAMLAFMRRCSIRWFVVGSKSARVAQDLEACGYLRLRTATDGPVELLKVVQ
jgi:hypothetical protein